MIWTKLEVPRERASWVKRPRLLNRLDQAVDYPLTLVTAPPGSGKTSLLAAWVASLVRVPFKVSWLTLDERDQEPARFQAYLYTAFERLGVDAQPHSALHKSAWESSLVSLINLAAHLPEQAILILDDLHLAASPEIMAMLTFVIEHLPNQLHLILSSRSAPDLPLAQLRARGQLQELGARELSFTQEELSEFLDEGIGLHLSAEAVELLSERTEGWIAGAQLAALSIRDAPDPDRLIRSFQGSHRFIVDFLAEQVFEKQTAEIRDFLLSTSILDRFSASFCEAVWLGAEQDRQEAPGLSAKSQAILEYLEHSDLFIIPLDEERRWYRYHPLFAGFLRQRLHNSQPDRWADLHRRAARWLESHAFLAEAVDHALAIQEAGQAARLIEQIAETIWSQGEMVRLMGWLEALPANIVQERPRLGLYHAWLFNIRGQPEGRDARLQEAEVWLETNEGDPDAPLVEGMLATMYGIIAIMHGDANRTFDSCRQALDTLPPDNLVWRCVVYRNLGNANLLIGRLGDARQAFSQAYEMARRANNIYLSLISLNEIGSLDLSEGKLRHAAQIFRQALQLAREEGAPGLTITGALHVGLCEVLREWGDLEAAESHARAGIELGKKDGSLGVRVTGYTRLGWILRARGDLEAAGEAFRQAIELAPGLRRTAFIVHQESQAKLWSGQADRAALEQWLVAACPGIDAPIASLQEAACLEMARFHLSEDRLPEALQLLFCLEELARSGGKQGRLIEVLLLMALAHYRLGETITALQALAESLTLAEPEGYRRVFLDAGNAMQELLRLAAYRLKGSQSGRYAASLAGLNPAILASAAALEMEQGSELHAVIQPLSRREISILRLIAVGLSNQEIARELVVAPSTIHWHTKNIYNKLNVHSRTQASRVARELGLLA